MADNFAISEVHIFQPNLINTLRLGWNRFLQFQKGRDFNVNPDTIGLDTGVAQNCFGIPEFDIGDTVEGGFSNLGLQGCAGGRVATSYQIADDFNWTRRAHALKFGFNFLHDYSDYTITGSRGIFTFNGTQLGDGLTTSVLGSACNATPSPCPPLAVLVDVIAGLPTPGPGVTSINRAGSGRANIDQNIISGFAMDTYKLTQRLTLIAGLRYDFFTNVNESRDRFSAFDPNLGSYPPRSCRVAKSTTRRSTTFWPARLSGVEPSGSRPSGPRDDLPRRIRHLLRHHSTQ